MNDRAKTRNIRLVAGLAVSLLLAFVAWRVFTLAMAEHLSRQHPATALDWRSNHPEAQLRWVEKQTHKRSAGGDQQDAAARLAIRSSPLDGRGYRLLAEQAQLRGELNSAMAWYSLASVRGPRDLPSHRWLANYALERGDYARALAHIDQMLRVQPELARYINPILIAISQQADAQAAVAKLLLQSPPWRSDFMPSLIRGSKDSSALFGLMERLRRSPSGLTDSELSEWIDRLTRDRAWGAAYLIWAQTLSPEASQRIGNVYNGSFETEPSHSGFDWRIDPIPGAQVSRVQVTGAKENMALRVAFEGRRVPFKNVRQLLALAPGTYRLQGQAKLDDLRSERGLVWTLTCAEDNRLIAETSPISGRHGWGKFELKFTVPDADCGGQWLTLRIPARIPAEQRIGGVAWFDDLQIQATAR